MEKKQPTKEEIARLGKMDEFLDVHVSDAEVQILFRKGPIGYPAISLPPDEAYDMALAVITAMRQHMEQRAAEETETTII